MKSTKPSNAYLSIIGISFTEIPNDDRTQCGICFYTAGPQTGVVLDVSPKTAMCVRNVDVQMCPAVHTMTRS